MSPNAPIVAPSILSADFSRFSEALAIADPALDWLHCDVMDNHFVPNLTFGPIIIGAARRLTKAFLDVHLMMERPWGMIDEFRAAGGDGITVHLEACPQTREVLRTIKGIREIQLTPAGRSKIAGHDVLTRYAGALGGRLHQAIYFDDSDITTIG